MPLPAISPEDLPDEPDVTHLVTEDDSPLDNWFQDKQAKLLTETLDVSWPEGRPFVSGADVGIFFAVKEAIVPDVLLAIGVEPPPDYHEKARRSYFTWVFGKSPDLVVEVVSNREGQEDQEKLASYARIHIPYYVIYDPQRLLSQRPVRIYQLSGASYVEKVDRMFPELGLGMAVWPGTYDGFEGEWLRWTTLEGQLLETGRERSGRLQTEVQEQERRAQEQEHRANSERARREALEAELRRLGVDPTRL